MASDWQETTETDEASDAKPSRDESTDLSDTGVQAMQGESAREAEPPSESPEATSPEPLTETESPEAKELSDAEPTYGESTRLSDADIQARAGEGDEETEPPSESPDTADRSQVEPKTTEAEEAADAEPTHDESTGLSDTGVRAMQGESDEETELPSESPETADRSQVEPKTTEAEEAADAEPTHDESTDLSDTGVQVMQGESDEEVEPPSESPEAASPEPPTELESPEAEAPSDAEPTYGESTRLRDADIQAREGKGDEEVEPPSESPEAADRSQVEPRTTEAEEAADAEPAHTEIADLSDIGSQAIQPEAWQGLNETERLDALQNVEDQMANVQGRPPAEVSTYAGSPGEYGYYDDAANQINISDHHVMNDDVRDVVDTTIHEGRHAYQHYAVEHPGFHDNAAEVKAWRENLQPGNYLSAEDYGQELYQGQPVEADAWSYGCRIADGVYEEKDKSR